MANNITIQNAEYVEVIIPSGNTKTNIYFPDLPNLRNKPIYGIEIFSADTQGTTNSGATNQAKSDLVNASVTLYYDGGEYIVVPAISLMRLNGSTYFGDIPNLAGQNIVWTKSYVSMNANVSNFANKNFLFSVYYKR